MQVRVAVVVLTAVVVIDEVVAGMLTKLAIVLT